MFNLSNRKFDFRPSNYIGHALALLMAIYFVLVYSQAIYSVLYWKDYFFKDAYRIEFVCNYYVKHNISDEFPVNPKGTVILPNNKPLDFDYQASDTAFIKHSCNAPILPQKNVSGMAMLHLGWIDGGEGTEIFINGSKRAHTSGKHKVSLGLLKEDLALESMSLTLITEIKNGKNVGASGYAPIVIGANDRQNQQILGLTFALDTFYSFVNISPVLVISIFLALSWFTGIRSRLTVVTFYYFALIATHNMTQIFPEYMPWDDVMTGQMIWGGFMPAVAIGFIIFCMELLGIYPRKINLLMSLNIVGLIAVIAYILLYSLSLEQYLYIYNLQLGIKTLGSVFLITTYFIKRKDQAKDRYLNRVRNFLIILAALYGLLAAYELFMGIVFNSYVGFSSRVIFIVCIVVGLVVFYAISLIEKNYQVAKSERDKIKTRLELGQAVQDLLLPDAREGKFAGDEFKFYFEPADYMAGDWLAYWPVDDRELRLIIGDVTGKGPQAALAVSAIASVVEECKQRNTSLPECFRAIHGRLRSLFKERVGTTLSAVSISEEGNHRIYNCGATGWISINSKNEMKAHALRSTGLGTSSRLEIGEKEIELEPGSLLIAFTDGVLEGSRALKKLQRSLERYQGSNLQSDIHEIINHAGTGYVHEDDKTMLVLSTAQRVTQSF